MDSISHVPRELPAVAKPGFSMSGATPLWLERKPYWNRPSSRLRYGENVELEILGEFHSIYVSEEEASVLTVVNWRLGSVVN